MNSILDWVAKSQRETEFMKQIGTVVVTALRDGVRPEFVVAMLEFHATTIKSIEAGLHERA